LHAGFKTGASSTRRAQAITNLQHRADQLRKLNLTSTVAFDPEQEAAILLARGDSMGKGSIAFLEALDAPAEDARKREPSTATRSDIKAMLLRIQQRERINEGSRERITRKMAEASYADATWYADVPDGMASIAQKIQVYDQAFLFFDALVAREPNNKREYRKWQTEALRNAIRIDPKDPGVDLRFENLAKIWTESTLPDSGVPVHEQIESAKKLADLARSIRNQLINEKNRSGQLPILETYEKRLREKAKTLEAASQPVKNRPN
jgi:hypothetical protein